MPSPERPLPNQEKKGREKIPPWMTRGEWLSTLTEGERSRTHNVILAAQTIFSYEFGRNRVGLFAIGLGAVPPGVVDGNPEAIQMRLTLSDSKFSENTHELYLLLKKIETTYNSTILKNLKAMLGNMRFNSEHDEENDFLSYSADFSPSVGRPIKLYLPSKEAAVLGATTGEFLKNQLRRYRGLREELRILDAMEQSGSENHRALRKKLIQNAYTVNLLE